MASTVANSPITNLVPVWSSDDDREKLLQFRSIERTGYLTVTELVRDFLYDATQELALTIVNVSIVETHLSNANAKSYFPERFQQNTVLDPTQPKFLSQRIRTINTAGAGYQVGDILTHFVTGANANVQVVVTEVDTDNVKGVKSFEVLNSGTYNTTVNPLGTNKRLEFRRRVNTKAAMVKGQDFSYDNNSGNIFIFQSRHSGNGYVSGTQAGPTPVPAFNGVVYTTPAGTPDPLYWSDSFTSTSMPAGRGGTANVNSTSPYTITSALTSIVAGSTGTRWPSDGIWSNIGAAQNTEIFVGSEILLKPGNANVLSFIPPGTLITRIDEIEVVTGLISKTRTGIGPQPTDYYEDTRKFIWFTTNQNVQIDKGDHFYVRGNGFTFNDNTTSSDTADVFTVITQAKARIDPLASDRQPVTANVLSINGNSVRLTNIRHGWADWAPTIFEGMVITHGAVDTNGATVANIANIQYSKTVGGTTANIVTDVAIPGTVLTSPAGTGLTFTFNTDQSYRLAFEANGKQTLSIYAGTAVQFRDDCKIAKVTDYTGSVTDLSGIMGDVPSIPVLSNVSPDLNGGERLNNVRAFVNVSIGANTTISGRTQFEVKEYTGNAAIQPGFVVALHANGNIKLNTTIESQITPLLAGEKPGGVGRYLIANNVVYTANVPSTSNLTVGRVVDRRVDVNDITQGFVNRSIRVANHPESYPLSYFTSFTNRGLFFGVWEGTWSIMQKTRTRQLNEKDAWFSWFLIQRPVNRKTGQVRTTGQSPVFCINSVGYKYWKFVVRERDVMHPTQGDSATTAFYYNDLTGKTEVRATPYRVPADAHTEDSHGILNTTHQIALTEDSKYLVSFLYNLTTPRFRYSDELDMIGQTAGDVSMASSDIKITAYSEATQRVYKALSANLPYNAGLRVSVIKDIYTA